MGKTNPNIDKITVRSALKNGSANVALSSVIWGWGCLLRKQFTKPIVVYTLLTSFAGPFKDFMLAKVLCGPNKAYYTVAVGMYQMLEKEYIDEWFCSFAAAAVIISIPIAALFLATQKYYATGVSGAVKG